MSWRGTKGGVAAAGATRQISFSVTTQSIGTSRGPVGTHATTGHAHATPARHAPRVRASRRS